MSPARRAALLAAGGVIVVLGVAFVAWRAGDGGSRDPRSPSTGRGASGAVDAVVTGITDARSPFETLTAGTIVVGGRERRVVVADEVDERIQGLRGRSDAAPYEGMLFVFDRSSTGAFTMAGVPGPLDIAFFDDAGRRVDELRMEPCVGTDATCPTYRSAAPYRYSLETAAGAMPDGNLGVVAR